MTDKYEQPSWHDGSQEEIAHLFARREYLTERMEAATDPNLRSSFAYEISVLEARLADLTKPAPIEMNGRQATNGNGSANGNGASNGEATQPTSPPEPADTGWSSDHDEIPEEFYQTLEISSLDLDAAQWPENAARPEPLHQPAPPEELEPVEYLGDEHRLHKSRTVEVQPMDRAPTPYQPHHEPIDPGPQIEQFAHVDDYDLQDLPDQHEEPQLFSDQESFGMARPFDDVSDHIPEPPDQQPQYADPQYAEPQYPEPHNRKSQYPEPQYVPSDDQERTEAGYDEFQDEHTDLADHHGLERFVEDDRPEDESYREQNSLHDADEELFDHNSPVDQPAARSFTHEEEQQFLLAQQQQRRLQEQQHLAEQVDYFGRPLTSDQPETPQRHEMPQKSKRPISAALSSRQERQQRQAESDRQRYFDEDETSEAEESEVRLSGFGKDRLKAAPALVVATICLAILAGVLWLGGQRTANESAQSITSGGKTQSQASEQGPEMAVANVRELLDRLDMGMVVVDYRNGTIHVGGPVPSQSDLEAVTGAVNAVANDYPVDTSALVVLEPGISEDQTTTTPAPAAPVANAGGQLLQSELDRILAVTPLIFGTGQTDLTDLHKRVLNSAVVVLINQPGAIVTITGYTDEEGSNNANRQVSFSRAENVKSYLVSQGVTEESLRVDARGEESATGSAALAGLERRVEFEVEAAPAGAEKTGPIRVAVVAPSAMNDLAFTQSMVDAVNLMAQERGIEISVTDNTFVSEEAAAAVENYAEQGYDLVIAHGSQFGADLIDIAPRFPTTAFAWGTASDTFGLPNVYAYDAAAEEGGYVLGSVATMMSSNKISGIVAPIEVGDAAQYVRGFQAGAQAEDPASSVLVTYTGSFSDITLASEAAQAHMDAGAEVLTGSAQMVVGAVSAADQRGVKWFGTQANQASLAPNSVVASQVYRWDVALGPILDDVEAGTLAGTTYTANLANGGLVIEFNPAFPVAEEILNRANAVTNAIIGGEIDP